MDYSFWQGERGEKRLGMLERGSSRWVADLHECHLTPPWFMDAVAATRDWWLAEDIPAFQPHLDQGALRRLTLREGRLTGERMAILTVSTHYEEHMSQEQVERWAQAVGDCSSVYLQVHRSIKGTPTQFPVTLLRGKPTIREIYRWQDQQLVFEISPHAFAQPNHAQAEQIYNLAWELASVEPDDLVYDLYCGTGAFACYAGLQSRNVLGIESCQQAVEDARRNAAANGLSHVRFEVGDVGKMLQQELPKPDLVVVDPPRPGLGNAVTPLLKLAPERLVYVSCNPRSQAIDVARLIQEGGYRLDAVAPVDQFPHTSHVENICLLVRS
jgi:23S rRNA (uracil-5-)-methyltransferase RumA